MRDTKWLGVLLALWAAAPLAAQPEEPGLPADVEKAIREGAPETLESKFRGGRNPDEQHFIAKAWANKARRARIVSDRERAIEKADERYRQWIESLEKAPRGDAAAKADVALAGARVEYGGMLMGLRAAGELDQFEITAGQKGDRKKLLTVLAAARELYEKAGKVIGPLYEERNQREDEFLAAGIYDSIINLRLDITFNEGWANYYLGLVSEAKEEQKRAEFLRTAERKFQELLDSGQTGKMLYQCYLGLAMAQREMKRFADADKNFAQAQQEGVDAEIEAQVRCERARNDIADGKFEEARTILKPLVEKDAKDLPPEERATRFYINLAALLDANSHLVEAEVIRAEAATSTAKTAILRRAERAREMGLSKLNRLAAKGGPWPGIVQIYVAASVNLREDPAKLSTTELLYSARQLMEAKRFKDALRRLQEAASRPEFQKPAAQRTPEDSELGGQIIMELGKCHYELKDLRQAGDTFDKLARDYRGHELAPQAATFAYRLRVEVAKASKQKDDYARLADALLNLIQSFPDHPDRAEAAWLLPVALQAAGRYAQAADEFAKTPESSKRRDEAQFRQVLCRRLALESERGAKPPEEYVAQAEKALAALTGYADAADRRAVGLTATEAKDLKKWSAEARLNAAELLAGQGVERFEPALASVADFETRYPESELVGRVLAVRIRAYRGLRQFDKATEILEKYLQTVPAEQAGAVLSSLARGMQEEVERLQQDGQVEVARKLAAESVDTFVQLEQWLRKDEKRARNVAVVVFGRAQMLFIAGQLDQARQIVTGLLKEAPQNGNYQRLLAQVLTAQLPAAAPPPPGTSVSPEQLKAAKDAWAELLKDPAIRKRAPERYWEARYNWLALLLREGNAAEVDSAIKQELVWYADLGGPPWREKLLELRRQARTTLGLPEEEPATEPAEKPTEKAGEPAAAPP